MSLKTKINKICKKKNTKEKANKKYNKNVFVSI